MIELAKVMEQEQRIKRFLISKVGQDNADDLWQDLLIKVVSNPDLAYRDQGKLPAFLMVAANNMAMDFYRRQNGDLPLDALTPKQEFIAKPAVRAAGIQGLSPRLNAAMTALKLHSVNQFRAVYLRYVRDWPSAMVAEEIGITTVAERKLVQRGLAFLREWLTA